VTFVSFESIAFYERRSKPWTSSPVYTMRFNKRFDNRLDVCLHDTAGGQTGCTTGCIV